jgi:hypothetical protein
MMYLLGRITKEALAKAHKTIMANNAQVSASSKICLIVQVYLHSEYSERTCCIATSVLRHGYEYYNSPHDKYVYMLVDNDRQKDTSIIIQWLGDTEKEARERITNMGDS